MGNIGQMLATSQMAHRSSRLGMQSIMVNLAHQILTPMERLLFLQLTWQMWGTSLTAPPLSEQGMHSTTESQACLILTLMDRHCRPRLTQQTLVTLWTALM